MTSLLLLTLLGADSVWLTNTGEKKILVIKEVRAATNLGLADAKKLVESTPQKVKSGLTRADADALVGKFTAVGATAEVRSDDAAAPAAAAPAKEAAGDYTVTLKSFGKSKIQVIKIVKDTLGLGLKESKELVESAPMALKRGLAKEAAEALAKQLNDVGGEVVAVAEH